MTRKTLAITRRRLIGALTAVGFASAGAGAGTVAMLSDTESDSATVSAGTIDLQLDGDDQTVQFLTEADITAGAAGTATVDVANSGSRTGQIIVEVAALRNYENGLVNNEGSEDDTGGDPGQGNGELQDYFEVAASFADGTTLWTGYDTIAAKLSTGTVYETGYQLASGDTGTFELDWQLPNNVSRVVQSDSIELELSFELRQTTGG